MTYALAVVTYPKFNIHPVTKEVSECLTFFLITEDKSEAEFYIDEYTEEDFLDIAPFPKEEMVKSPHFRLMEI